MEKSRADLHIHTYYSDGLISPAEVAAEAEKNGVGIIAVTDHDCMLAYPELDEICKMKKLKAVNGTEISAYENGIKIHVLGYNADPENPILKNFLKRLHDGSYERAEDIIRKLNKNGVRVSFADVSEYRKCPSSPVHTMHIARCCASRGYAGGNPFNFYAKYLAKDCPAYSEICRPSPEEAVKVITACGGLASLAHPGRIDTDKAELLRLIKKLCGFGLGGIEAVYSTHTVTETAYYKEIAKTFSLAVTGGSDFHASGGRRSIGSPVFLPDEALAEKLGI